MSGPLAEQLERLSGYRSFFPVGHPDQAKNPVSYSHWRIQTGGRTASVPSRVSFAIDYSRRTSRFAHHVVLDPAEQSAAGPAWAMMQPGAMETGWAGDPRYIPEGRQIPRGESAPRVCAAWQAATGDAGWAGVLAEAFALNASRPAYILYEPGTDLLPLIDEAIALLPRDVRWQVTFNTYFTALPAGLDCTWRCCVAGSDAAKDAQRFATSGVVIDLTKAMTAAKDSKYAEMARAGQMLAEPADGAFGASRTGDFSDEPSMASDEVGLYLTRRLSTPARRNVTQDLDEADAGTGVASLLDRATPSKLIRRTFEHEEKPSSKHVAFWIVAICWPAACLCIAWAFWNARSPATRDDTVALQKQIASLEEMRKQESERADAATELANKYSAAAAEAIREGPETATRDAQGPSKTAATTRESPPDVVATLDFPELPDWENLCLAYEMAPPPKLMMEVAQEVNESYAAELPVQGLLAKHRLLALAKAPLADRIALMRELAAQDTQNPWWEEDLRLFETARVGQLRGEAAAAVKARNGGRIGRLLEELEAPGWRADVPTDLTRALRQTAHEIRRHEVAAQLRDTLPQLETAYNAMDFEETARRLAEWDGAAVEAEPLPADLLEHVTPVRRWVADERRRHASQARFKTDCSEWKQAIDRDAPTEELLALRVTAETHGMSLPADLVSLGDALIEQRESARRRRVRRNVALTAAVVLLCAGGVGWIVRQNMVARQARQWVGQVTQHVEAGRLADAASAWDEMLAHAPGIQHRLELLQARRALDAAVSSEDGRRAKFRQRMDRALASGPRTPDRAALDEAGALARTPADRLEVLNFTTEIGRRASEGQRGRDGAFEKGVVALADDVRRMERDILGNAQLDTLGRRIAAAEKASAVLATSDGVGAVARASLEPVSARLAAVRKRFDENAAQLSELAKVTSAAPGELAGALKSFASRFPDSPRAAASLRAAEDEGAWESVLAWSSLTSGWGHRFVPSSPADIRKRVQQLDGFTRAHAGSPLAASVNAYREYLNRAETAVAPDGPWKSGLVATMNSPLVSRLNRLRTTDGRTYYLVGNGDLSVTRIADRVEGYRFKGVVTNDIEKPAQQSVKGELQVQPGPSPQAKLSADVLRMIAAFGCNEWETFGPAVLDRIRTDKELDPILGVILATRVLRFTDAAGWGMGEHMRNASEALDALNADDLSWMDPSDGNAEQVRPRAREALSAIPAAGRARQTVATHRQSVFAPVSFRVHSTAVIVSERGKPVVRSAAKPGDGHQVLAILPTEGGGGKSLRRIGGVKGGVFQLDPAATRLTEGSLVFICEPSGGPRAAPARSLNVRS